MFCPRAAGDGASDVDGISESSFPCIDSILVVCALYDVWIFEHPAKRPWGVTPLPQPPPQMDR